MPNLFNILQHDECDNIHFRCFLNTYHIFSLLWNVTIITFQQSFRDCTEVHRPLYICFVISYQSNINRFAESVPVIVLNQILDHVKDFTDGALGPVEQN